LKIPWRNGEKGSAFFYVNDVVESSHYIPDQSSQSCSRYAHIQGQDHDGVQDDIRYGSQEHTHHGLTGSPFCSQDITEGRGDNDKGSTGSHNIQVISGIANCIATGPDHPEDLWHENPEEEGKNDS
jgi:hypothetical protein